LYLKVIFKQEKGKECRTPFYRLVESYRYDDMVRQQTILHLGKLDELPDVEHKKQLAKRIDDLVRQSRTGMQCLFVSDNEVVEKLAHSFFEQMKLSKKIDLCRDSNRQVVDLETVRNKDVKEVGAEWLCKQTLDQLKVKDLLKQNHWSDEQINLAYTHIISKASKPASEYKTSSWIKQNSAICELTGYDVSKITKDKLYGIAKDLYAVKDKLERHLSTTTNELFDLEDKIILYDLTNTYFEGSMRKSKLAKYGRSKEKRNDAKLIVMAAVVNVEGFLKYSEIFEGNLTDSKSLIQIIEKLSSNTDDQSVNSHKQIVVMDAGIANVDNLKILKEKGYDYMCVSRGGMSKYQLDMNAKETEVKDNKGQSIKLQKVTMPDSTDTFVQVKSINKGLKESGMNSRFSQKFEEGLIEISRSLTKRNGTKKLNKVWERIGRLKQKYSSATKYYDIQTPVDANNIVTSIDYKIIDKDKKEGVYLLRTTLNTDNEKTLWTIYNCIREIESTFRILKTDLDLRPIYHKSDDASKAHLHLGILAYWLVNTVRYQLKQKGINHNWQEVVRIMNTQKAVTTTMVNEYNQTIVIRQCSEPTQESLVIYNALNFKSKPFSKKKFVVPPDKIQKTKLNVEEELRDISCNVG
jgi:Transposase DDE domain